MANLKSRDINVTIDRIKWTEEGGMRGIVNFYRLIVFPFRIEPLLQQITEDVVRIMLRREMLRVFFLDIVIRAYYALIAR